MLHAEIIASTSGQAAACRRSYASTWSGFRPIICPTLRTATYRLSDAQRSRDRAALKGVFQKLPLLPPFTRPRRPGGIGVGGNRRGIHRHAIPRSVRGHIAATTDDDRMHKMLVQVGGVLEHAAFQRAANRDVVEEREMLHIFTQANASCVRADRDAELGGHKENRQDFVYPADAAGIDLADTDSVGLKELLEDD